MSILTLETYYRFSPLMLPGEDDDEGQEEPAGDAPGPAMDEPGMDDRHGRAGMGEPAMGEPGMGG